MTKTQAERLLREAEGYLDLELWDEVEPRLAAVEATGSFPVECALLRGEMGRARGRYAEAIPCFQQVLEARPADVPATVGLGWCLKRLGRLPEAIRAYQTALHAHPKEPLLYYNLACYHSLAGHPNDALDLLSFAVEMEEAYRTLAREEPDFDPVRDNPDFDALLQE